MRGRNKTAAPGVVAEVEARTAEAAALAGIAGQHRLADPRLNPATRPHADRLRDVQQVRALDAEHSRLLRRHRVADARAEDAERTLEAIALARRASSPARSVLALHNGRRTWSRLSLAASVVLAVGSAMGVEAAAEALTAPAGTGYVAELGLTGLATAAITYRAHLAEHRGRLEPGSWQKRTLWVLMTVPLLVSVAANGFMVNLLGAACSIGAAAFAALGAVVADRSAAAMQDRAAEVDEADEDGLRAVAMGDDLFAPVAELPGEDEDPDEGDGQDAAPFRRVAGDPPQDDENPAEDEVSGEARAGVAELAAWLAEQEPPAEGAPAAEAPAPDGGPTGTALDVPRGHIEGAGGRQGGHIDSEQDGPEHAPEGAPGPGSDAGRVLAAAEARRALGASTRHRISEYLAEHPGASNSAVAAALGMSTATVKRHRRGLRRQDGGRS